jgi:hypothetical protein
MGTIGARVENLDLATVIEVSQAVSSEIVLENMIDTLMRSGIAQAAAFRFPMSFAVRRRRAG